eukprot:CAMPEP_0195078498 /NCGR_PEP_ID=MMETSP0448-20130528/20675_1 /TAXON_ID=66468 /ORGANISM="Heterocapsa triquestra, Strain CCMP 448" /LENGTH=428 /DNA_ID=CAMNT_0040111243 /DNA_START=94 /DNA_END=1377 /DNA_ORIENTATION=-
MSWYVGQDGQQVWIKRDEMVYTVVLSDGKLPEESLTYLTSHSKKAVYQEHMCDEDALDGKSRVPRRHRDKQAGSQRGYIIRVENEDKPLSRVVPWFKGAAQKLLDADVISRMDAEDSANINKKKKGSAEEKKGPSLGVNECRVETTSRVSHFAHGPGFRVEVAEGVMVQRIHFFTNRRELAHQDWHRHLVEAIEHAGGHVMLSRKLKAEAEVGGGKNGTETKDAIKEEDSSDALRLRLRKDKAQQDDDAWLASMIDHCLVVDPSEQGDQQRSPRETEAAEQPTIPPRPEGPPPRPKAKPKDSAAPARPAAPPACPTVSLSQKQQVQKGADADNWRSGPRIAKAAKAAAGGGTQNGRRVANAAAAGVVQTASGLRVANAAAGGGSDSRAAGSRSSAAGAKRPGQAGAAAGGRAQPQAGAPPSDGGWRPS